MAEEEVELDFDEDDIPTSIPADSITAPTPNNAPTPAPPAPKPKTKKHDPRFDANGELLPYGWESKISSKGDTYYKNLKTGKSSWVVPREEDDDDQNQDEQVKVDTVKVAKVEENKEQERPVETAEEKEEKKAKVAVHPDRIRLLGIASNPSPPAPSNPLPTPNTTPVHPHPPPPSRPRHDDRWAKTAPPKTTTAAESTTVGETSRNPLPSQDAIMPPIPSGPRDRRAGHRRGRGRGPPTGPASTSNANAVPVPTGPRGWAKAQTDREQARSAPPPSAVTSVSTPTASTPTPAPAPAPVTTAAPSLRDEPPHRQIARNGPAPPESQRSTAPPPTTTDRRPPVAARSSGPLFAPVAPKPKIDDRWAPTPTYRPHEVVKSRPVTSGARPERLPLNTKSLDDSLESYNAARPRSEEEERRRSVSPPLAPSPYEKERMRRNGAQVHAQRTPPKTTLTVRGSASVVQDAPTVNNWGERALRKTVEQPVAMRREPSPPRRRLSPPPRDERAPPRYRSRSPPPHMRQRTRSPPPVSRRPRSRSRSPPPHMRQRTRSPPPASRRPRSRSPPRNHRARSPPPMISSYGRRERDGDVINFADPYSLRGKYRQPGTMEPQPSDSPPRRRSSRDISPCREPVSLSARISGLPERPGQENHAGSKRGRDSDVILEADGLERDQNGTLRYTLDSSSKRRR